MANSAVELLVLILGGLLIGWRITSDPSSAALAVLLLPPLPGTPAARRTRWSARLAGRPPRALGARSSRIRGREDRGPLRMVTP
jgi:hypothetical protein